MKYKYKPMINNQEQIASIQRLIRQIVETLEAQTRSSSTNNSVVQTMTQTPTKTRHFRRHGSRVTVGMGAYLCRGAAGAGAAAGARGAAGPTCQGFSPRSPRTCSERDATVDSDSRGRNSSIGGQHNGDRYNF